MSGTHDLSPEALAQYGSSRNLFDQIVSLAGDASYVYVTRNYDDTVEVDFTLNPFLAAEIEKPNPILNPSSLEKFDKPSFYSIGFDRNGVQVYSERTTQTFQPSQGFYQDLVTLEQTGFKFDAFEFLIPPEATTVFHSHINGVEIFYVLGGEPANDDNPNIVDNDSVVFELNADVDGVFNLGNPGNPFSALKDEEIELNGVKVTKGSFVAVPAGKIHTWANTGQIPATVIALIVPSGIAEGFITAGASGGIYDPSPPVHPILERNGTSNLIPTGVTPTEVNGILPGDANFYDFFQQIAINPGLLEQLGFTNFPSYLQGADPVTVYGVSPDGSGAFKLNPSDEAGVGGVANPNGGSALQGDDSPGIEAITTAPADPFSESTFANPFTVLRFGQNDGVLNPTPIETKLFSISSEEGEYSVTSDNHEFFGVLDGELVFEFGENGNDLRHLQVVKEGDYIYIEPGNHFHLWASDQLESSSANLIQFSALAEPAPRLVVGTPNNDTAIANLPSSNVNVDGFAEVVFLGAGDDTYDATQATPSNNYFFGKNRVNSGSGRDILFATKNDRLFGGSGDDEFDATDGNGGNRMSGGDGNDTFFLGAGDRALGGNGNDQFYVQIGGSNLLSGGAGADQFWMLTDAIPFVANTITDFVSGVDVIGIANQGAGVDFNDLSLVGNTIAFKGQENQPFATLTGIQTNTLTAANFVFS